jgi:hypothetical protein
MERMVLLGVLVDPEILELDQPEQVALSVLSTAIISGGCMCGGEWETVQDDMGNTFPTIVHQIGCPGAGKHGRSAVQKVLKHIVYQALADDQ